MADGHESFPRRTYLQSLRNHCDCLEDTISKLIILLKSITEEHDQHRLFDEIEKLDGIASGIERLLDDMEYKF